MGGRINTDLVLNAITMHAGDVSQRERLLSIQIRYINTHVMIGRACLNRTI
jgi:hypothetical protein